ncbi:MAG: hypothetical protein ACE5OY_01550 [Candidatus Bathyarchaeia archaeon]
MLVDRGRISRLVRRVYPRVDESDIRVRMIGGLLSSVYLVEFPTTGEEPIVVKRFRDIRGPVKWIPVSMWTIGARRFAMNGEARLERQRKMSKFLRERGFPVPKILLVSLKDMVLFMEYVRGEKAAVILSRIIERGRALKGERAIVGRIGQRLGLAHKIGVAIGDTKDDNIIVTREGETYFVDLEQATRDRIDAIWDVAEFVYYAGHHVLHQPLEGMDEIVREFLAGYLEGGGDRGVVEKLTDLRYVYAFTASTLPHVLYHISNVCKEFAAKHV